jgi:formyl-CoA transferase
MRVEAPHPAAGTVPLVANPTKFSATPIPYDTPPPLLGQHTSEVLHGVLGLSEGRIAELRQKGVL